MFWFRFIISAWLIQVVLSQRQDEQEEQQEKQPRQLQKLQLQQLQQEGVQRQGQWKLQRQQQTSAGGDGVDITDATSTYKPSTESTFDHMTEIQDNLSFHWNDIKGDSFKARLIHLADSMDQAPSWLGFGVYHSNYNYTTLPSPSDTTNFMVGSAALIGLPTMEDEENPAQLYQLNGKMVDAIQPLSDTDTTSSFKSAFLLQHDSDDGTVMTSLSFTKLLTSSIGANQNIRREGTNIFLWAIGPPGMAPGQLGKHSHKGVIYVDLAAVQKAVEGGAKSGSSAGASSTTTNTTSNATATTSPSTTTSSTAGGSGTTTTTSNVVNTSPIIRGQCGSNLLDSDVNDDHVGTIALTPTLTFHWILVGENENKIQIALEYTGREAWLGVAASPNGYMLGSSAVIGIPNNNNDPPQQYSLNDKDINGVVVSTATNPPLLEDASIVSSIHPDDPTKFTTVLKFTKLLNDPNDLVPITKGGELTTFLYAVGASSRELAYHEHRGSFRVDVEDCGGSVTGSVNGTTTTSANTNVVWTNHGTFAAHGFFAALAWALATPFAVTVAWFRTLVPASWIYIHVFANVFTFLATLIVFSLAILGISKQKDPSAQHFSKSHHWVGLAVFFLAIFQVVNGFLRPPVERKDASALSNRNLMMQHHYNQANDTFLGLIPIPRTARETWQLLHRLSGLIAIGLSIYEIQSGLALYSERFQTKSMVNYYWMYVALFFFSLIALKFWVLYEEDKARRGVMQAVSTTEPPASSIEMQEQQDEGIGVGQQESVPQGTFS